MNWREHPIRLPEQLVDDELLLDAPTLADARPHYEREDGEMRLRFDSRRRATLDEMRMAMQRWIDGRAAGGPMFVYMARLPDAGLIGGCELRLVTPASANVSYWLYPGFRGRGLATRALRLLCAAAGDHPGLERLEAHIDPDNHASRRLAERLGFVESHTEDDTAWDGVVSTRAVYLRPPG